MHPTCGRLIPPRPEQATVPQSAAAFVPSHLGEDQMPEGGPHAEAEVGPKPKLTPRGCATKAEKQKSLPAAAQAAD